MIPIYLVFSKEFRAENAEYCPYYMRTIVKVVECTLDEVKSILAREHLFNCTVEIYIRPDNRCLKEVSSACRQRCCS